MTARTIVGALGLLVLLGVAVYLLLQVPAIFTIGGVVILAAMLFAIGIDEPDAL